MSIELVDPKNTRGMKSSICKPPCLWSFGVFQSWEQEIDKGDPDKWAKTEVNIRSEDQNEVDYKQLEMPPPIKGKHKFSHCQKLYEDVHRFMQHREWAYAHPEGNASGMT